MTRLLKYHKSQLINNILADVPIKLTSAKIRDRMLEIAIDRLPREIRKIWDNPDTQGYVKLIHAGSHGIYGWIPAKEDDRDTPQEILDLIDEHNRESNQRDILRKELYSNFSSISTIKQFSERFPELVKYLPVQKEVVGNLPATTHLVDKLKTLGVDL